MPFGEARTISGMTNISETDFGYTGQRNNSYIKLLDYKARSYSPYLNRFIQPDSIIPNLYIPQSLNRFSYTLNNPVKYIDPSGHKTICLDGVQCEEYTPGPVGDGGGVCNTLFGKYLPVCQNGNDPEQKEPNIRDKPDKSDPPEEDIWDSLTPEFCGFPGSTGYDACMTRKRAEAAVSYYALWGQYPWENSFGFDVGAVDWGDVAVDVLSIAGDIGLASGTPVGVGLFILSQVIDFYQIADSGTIDPFDPRGSVEDFVLSAGDPIMQNAKFFRGVKPSVVSLIWDLSKGFKNFDD